MRTLVLLSKCVRSQSVRPSAALITHKYLHLLRASERPTTTAATRGEQTQRAADNRVICQHEPQPRPPACSTLARLLVGWQRARSECVALPKPFLGAGKKGDCVRIIYRSHTTFSMLRVEARSLIALKDCKDGSDSIKWRPLLAGSQTEWPLLAPLHCTR